MIRLLIPSLLAVLAWTAPAHAANEPDGSLTNVYDLTRKVSKPLRLVHELGPGVWQHADDRKLGRLERDVVYSAAFKYMNDAGAAGWNSQAYLAIHDVSEREVEDPKAKDETARHFAPYVASLPVRYEAANFKVTVDPSPVRFQKNLRAGRAKVPVYFADLGVSYSVREGLREDYHVNVFGFVVRGWLVTLRVHFVGTDRTSAFLDGLRLTIKKRLPKGVRNVKLSSVTPDLTETRVSFQAPKGFRRLNTGAPKAVPAGQMIRMERRGKRGAWNAALDITRKYSTFDSARDLAAWKKHYKPLLGADPDLLTKRVKGLDMQLAMADAKVDGQDVTVCLLFFKLGTHRYTIRCEHLGVGKKVRAFAIKECTALLSTFQAWETRKSRS